MLGGACREVGLEMGEGLDPGERGVDDLGTYAQPWAARMRLTEREQGGAVEEISE